MDFEPSEEQQMLREAVADLLTKTYDIETIRKTADTDLGFREDIWNGLAEMGIQGLPFAEEVGGAGAGVEEVSTVMTAVGKALAPEPLLDAVYIPGGIIDRAGSDDQRQQYIPGLADGSTKAAFAHAEAGDRWPTHAVATTASGSGDAYTITGTKTLVAAGDVADVLVVSARDGGDVALFLVDATGNGVTRSGYRTHDDRRGAQITFDSAPATRLPGDATAALEWADVAKQTWQCAEAVGALESALHLTTEYLKQRKQFGVPLAKFQTLTQRAADMYVLLELASSMSLYATMSLDAGVDPTAATRTKLQICRASRKIGQEAIQMHGGIGMTKEYPVGHYVSRLVAIEHTLGGAEEHLALLADGVADYKSVSLVD